MTYDGFCEWRPLYWKIGYEYARLDEVNPKLRALLERHGLAFDDEWIYEVKGKGRYVHRRRHNWQPRNHYEKVHRY